MKGKILQFYEGLYGNKKEKSAFGLPEKELIKFLNSKQWKKAKALDLGCGDGRNTMLLASKNFKVLGIDNSISGLKKIKKNIKDTRIAENISLKKADLRKIKLKQKNYYDIVICVDTFHEIGSNGVKNVIKQAKFLTKPLGINYIAFFTPKKGTYMRKECYYPDESIILRYYIDWRIIKKKKTLFTHSHTTLHSKEKIRHEHYACYIILQKPKYCETSKIR